MGVGHTLMLSAASTRIFAAALLASFLPGVKADCWQDSDGSRTCDGIGTLTYIMIGFATIVVSLTIFFILYYAYRRRLANRANLAHIQQTQRESRAAYGGPYGSAGGLSPFSPQRPTPVHNDFNTPYIYNAATPTSIPPPQYYPPPPGASPVTLQK